MVFSSLTGGVTRKLSLTARRRKEQVATNMANCVDEAAGQTAAVGQTTTTGQTVTAGQTATVGKTTDLAQARSAPLTNQGNRGATLRGAHLVAYRMGSILVTSERGKPMSIPGGKPEGTEGPEACLEREIKEELGLKVTVAGLDWAAFTRRGVFFSGRVESVFFFLRDEAWVDALVAACRRHSVPYKWVDVRTQRDSQCAAHTMEHLAFLRSCVEPENSGGSGATWTVEPNPGPDPVTTAKITTSFSGTTTITPAVPFAGVVDYYIELYSNASATEWFLRDEASSIWATANLQPGERTTINLRRACEPGAYLKASCSPTTGNRATVVATISPLPDTIPDPLNVVVVGMSAQSAPMWVSDVAPAGPVIMAPPLVPLSATSAAPRVHTSGTTLTSGGQCSVEWDPGPFARHTKRPLVRGKEVLRLPRAQCSYDLGRMEEKVAIVGSSEPGLLKTVWEVNTQLLQHLWSHTDGGLPKTDRETVCAAAYCIIADFNPFELLPVECGSEEASLFDDCEAVETAEPRDTVERAAPRSSERQQAAASRPRRSFATGPLREAAPAGSLPPPGVPASVAVAQCERSVSHGNSMARDHAHWQSQVVKVSNRFGSLAPLIYWALGTQAPQKFIDAVTRHWENTHLDVMRSHSQCARLLNQIRDRVPLIAMFDAVMETDPTQIKSHWAYDAVRQSISDKPIDALNPVHAAGISRGDVLVGVELNPGPPMFAATPRTDADVAAAPASGVLLRGTTQEDGPQNRWPPTTQVLQRLSTLTTGVNPLAGNMSSVVGFSSRLSQPDATITAPFALPPPVTSLLPRAYFPPGGGPAAAAVVRPRWIEVADVNRQGAAIVETPLGVQLRENVSADTSVRKNVTTISFNGFPGGDMTNFDLGNALTVGLNLEAFLLKQWLYYLSDSVMLGSNARNRFGVMAQMADPNHRPVPANAVSYSVNSSAVLGEDCGALLPVFPGQARDISQTLQLHISLASISAADAGDIVVIPPGLLRGHLDPNAALAMYCQGVAPYPAHLPVYTTTGLDDNGANGTAVQFIPYSALVRIGGKRQIRLYLPRVGSDGSAIGNVAQATAAVGTSVRTGPFATATYAASTPVSVYAVGAAGTPVIFADYLRSWASNAGNTAPAISTAARLSFIKELCRLFPGAMSFAQSAYHKAIALTWRTVCANWYAPAAKVACHAETAEMAPCTLCGRVPPTGSADADAEMGRQGAMVEIPTVQNNVFNGLALGMLTFADGEGYNEALPPWSADNLFPHYALWDYVGRAGAWDMWYTALGLDQQAWGPGRTAQDTLGVTREISLKSWNTSDDPDSHRIRHARAGFVAEACGAREPWARGSAPFAASLLWTDAAPVKPTYRIDAGPAFTSLLGVVPQRMADFWAFVCCPGVVREFLPRLPGGSTCPLKWADWENCGHGTPAGGWTPPLPDEALTMLWRTDKTLPSSFAWRYNNALAWEAGVTAAGPLSPLAPTWVAAAGAVVYALPPSTHVCVPPPRGGGVGNACLPGDDPDADAPPTQPRNWAPQVDADGRVIWLVFASAGGAAQAMSLWGAAERGTLTYAWSYSGVVQKTVIRPEPPPGALVSLTFAAVGEAGKSPAEAAGLEGAPPAPGDPHA